MLPELRIYKRPEKDLEKAYFGFYLHSLYPKVIWQIKVG